jgi:hypothetical protein
MAVEKSSFRSCSSRCLQLLEQMLHGLQIIQNLSPTVRPLMV